LRAAWTVDELDACEGPWWRTGPVMRGLAARGLQAAVMHEVVCRNSIDFLRVLFREANTPVADDDLVQPHQQCQIQQLDLVGMHSALAPRAYRTRVGNSLHYLLRQGSTIADVRDCYRRALVADPGLTGRIALDLVMVGEAEIVRIDSATIDEQRTTLASSSLGACISTTLERFSPSLLSLHLDEPAFAPGSRFGATVTYELKWQ